MGDEETGAQTQPDGRDWLTESVTICNQRGLHARAAAKFARLASQYDVEVTVTRNDVTVSGHSIMGLMMLSAAPGCEVTLHVCGSQRDAALGALAALVQGKFDED